MEFSLNWSKTQNLMLLLPLLLLLLLHLAVSTATQNPSPYKPIDEIRLNNGEPSQMQSLDRLNWEGDTNSKYCPSNSDFSSPSTASQPQPSVPSIPYLTARIIRSNFTCIFPVSTGPKFIRLYFYPATYSGLNPSDSFFTVTANGYTLLNNFSATLASDSYMTKEFIVTVFETQHRKLNLTFTPSPNSFAFINGIEIVSMPNNLYMKDMNHPFPFVNQLHSPFYFNNATSLETVLRLNVGGQSVQSMGDTGMYRTWTRDSFIFGGAVGEVHQAPTGVKLKYTEDTPAFVAPDVVYLTKRTMDPDSTSNLNFNLTWIFPNVDPGFNYLVRLHFCETEEQINRYDRVFYIFINNMTAEVAADVIQWSGGRDIPVYKDYIVYVPVMNSNSKQDLWLSLHPNSDVSRGRYYNAILNGLEVFKLNSSDGVLAGSNPKVLAEDPPSTEQRPALQKSKESNRQSLLVPLSVVALSIGVAFCLFMFFIYRRKGKAKDTTIATRNKSLWQYFLDISSTVTTDLALPLPIDLCRQFTMPEIKIATRNFGDKNVIGSGGFGTVYKGFIGNGSIPVAIKRLDSSSKQGIREFRTEIEMLSKLRHAHLVSLIGYCNDGAEMILVYEFMTQGNLQDHIYKAKKGTLPWKQRLKICVGAANGLHYLHTGAKHTIIHRDVKSSNILLDSNWVAKVSDFGLSKTGPTSESQTHVSTVVRGTFGYLDPEYYRRQQLTEKSDVYSFGVVLLEVLFARPPVISTESKEKVNLVEWARKCYKRGTLDENIDPELKRDIATASLNKFMEIAESCVREKGTERPTMGDVVWGLEFALQLQETTDVDDVVRKRKESSFLAYERVTSTDDDDNTFTSSSAPILASTTTLSASQTTFSNSTDSNPAKPDLLNQDVSLD